ncbi:nicotinate-nucleotide--dimethylbenzimidazole phosphoribosyltransferase [Nocardioides sp. CFH 31398]|uniref:nicotinate-nucleotide--dimethylbenzimidazole phosphoribosyltransferase n=1 Tax=Nocardioides sp. CFH 31398 TaxID=2919579 RepID=UPI001F06EC04|nr:nicotinate-nucleotide--dimethylbenzimidazole phosphoribosyltransferase [Nocardioides sp. CFH 31398]MCH1865545.1 nicotinate-nucleotide--dimethylbenzimidazole phosphoribosyltransferase [Nocardioides sp. CFH 31398]
MRAPDAAAEEAARERLAGLATPAGALGRLGDLAVWVAACQAACPPEPLDDVVCVVLAGDHGVAAHGVSAYPAEITGLMVATLRAGRAGVSALAAAHGVAVRVEDVSVGRPSAPLHLTDAVSRTQAEAALARGRAIAAEERGRDLVVPGEVGIGNTTPAAALTGALLGLPATEVTGTGTGLDGEALARKTAVVQAALDRTADLTDPVDLLAALGGEDLAVMTGLLLGAAEAGVPVLLDGVVSVACALAAEAVAPGVARWFAAGHRSTEPAQAVALEKLGLVPVLDAGMRLGEGSGAVAAVPLLRGAVALLRDTASLEEVLRGG